MSLKKVVKIRKETKSLNRAKEAGNSRTEGVSSAHVRERSGPGRGASAFRFLIRAGYENSFDWLARRLSHRM